MNEFEDLFDGNRNAVGEVWGEYTKVTPLEWRERLSGHLKGVASVGVYPLVGLEQLSVQSRADWDAARMLQAHHDFQSELWVKWGCTDLDEGYEKSFGDAVDLVYALKKLGIQGHVERTKSKGWHVWVFASEWVPAEVMRRALLAAHQAAGVRPVEVNPKQTTLASLGRGVGNYVNLPYYGNLDNGTRVMVAADIVAVKDLSLTEWYRTIERTEFTTLLQAARLYVEPPKRDVGTIEEPDGNLKDVTDKLTGLAYTIYSKGPLEGMDRSDTLARLGHKCRESNLTPGETLAVLRDADRRWGKFADRPDCEQQLQKLVENAYK